jgi:SAM-dependent methyltransferase
MPRVTESLPDFAPCLFDAEDRHFWFRARNTILSRLIGQIVKGLPSGYRVLEVGCGNGNVLRMLEQVCANGELLGMDLVAEKLEFARRRVHCTLRQGDLRQLSSGEAFHLIGMFDVLEHLEDDHGALRALGNALRRDGLLVLTVPAHWALWSYADTHAGHYRRYDAAHLERLLQESGLHVEFCTQFMAALYPLMWLGRRLASLWRSPKAGPHRDRALFCQELRVIPFVNDLLMRLLVCEAPLIARRCRLPIGTSLLAVARKE